MGVFSDLIQNLYLNFYSFGTLVVAIFTFLLSLFFLGLPKKSKSTFHLGMAFLFLFIFSLGYFLAAIYYSPNAAFHRWLTGGLILPLITHLGQFFLKYPRDTNPGLSKNAFKVLYSFAIFAALVFCGGTAFADKKYHFTGHYWDFDSPRLSVALAVLIAVYIFINFISIPIWKYYQIKNQKEKKTILYMMFAMLIAGVLPNFTNIMSRDGAMERSTYLISLVLCFVIGFFMVSIIYINSTKETTTFMAKIVGLTLVSILLVVQAWGFYMAQEQDGEYNSLKIEKLFNVLDTGLAPKSVEYILRYPKGSEKIEFTRYPSITRLDLSLVEADFKNTIIFEDLQNLDVENYKEELLKYLQTTHPEFIGYKKSILNFVKEHPELKKQELKAELFSYLEGLNRATFIHANKISNFATEGFCKKLESFIKRSASSIKYFREPILQELKSCTWEESPENVALYRRNVYKHLRHFTPALSRHYRLSSHPYREQKHYIVFRFYDRFAQVLTEVGYSYTEYREEMHSVFKIQTFILLIAVIFITVFYPLFFKGSLLNPLRNLLQGVRKVNKGDLDLEIKVIFHDEIGFLSESFNSMVNSIRTARRELQDYAENLEEKVAERTREVEERMEEIKKLKVQQDGDYYLTSLLAKPLFLNANKSQSVKTEFLIYQKKQFEFRNRKADLGGDICVTGNVKLGNPDTEEFRRYTLAMNGDAMGKSMQGAGGSLVMGVVINSIMRRAADKGIIPNSPQEWLTKVYHEINGIFKAFNGTMVISCVIMLIDDETGEVFYFNAEHPFCVLYRNGDVRFIEKDMQLRKLGLDSEIEFQVYKYQLIPGDVIIMGSDGRDDIDMSPNEVIRTINEDTSLFLNHVRIGKGKLEQIKASILTTGSLIDDLSLLRLAFKESEVELGADEIELSNTDYIYEQCKLLLNDGKLENAKFLLDTAYQKDPSNPKISKLFGLVCFKVGNYEDAAKILESYLKIDPDNVDYWYYLSVSHKKLGRYNSALESSLQLMRREEGNVMNLVNMADIYRLVGQYEEAISYSERALEKDPENKSAKRLLRFLKS